MKKPWQDTPTGNGRPNTVFFVYLPKDLWPESRDFWETLVVEFGQNAIVVAEPGKPAKLLITDKAFRQQLETAAGKHL